MVNARPILVYFGLGANANYFYEWSYKRELSSVLDVIRNLLRKRINCALWMSRRQ
jgi:hypothetical protein